MPEVDTTTVRARPCPLCGAKPKGISFPYATHFNNLTFRYLECGSCSSVYVDPAPDSETLARMYAKSDYHDLHYEGIDGGTYVHSAKLLRKYLPAGAMVLDYGCGTGAFLKALGSEGFVPVGVEFDQDAARFAGKNAQCQTFSLEEFSARGGHQSFDAVHLGDVLEHLADPASTLKALLSLIKPGGLLFVEGPLETNLSPVYWAAKLFGRIKRIARPGFVASHPPTHLFRTNGKQQLRFFNRVDSALSLEHWETYETGWPYSSGGKVKRLIAGAAIGLSGRRVLGITFGNRFCGIFVCEKALGQLVSRSPASS